MLGRTRFLERRPVADRQHVDPAVIMALELEHLGLARESACGPYGAANRLRTGIRKTDEIGARRQKPDCLGKFHFGRIDRSEHRAPRELLRGGLHELGMGMAEDQGPVAQEKIDEHIAVDVLDSSATTALHV